MADYGYMNRGRVGPRFQAWETKAEEGWSTPNVVTKTEVHREHVCRPVIVDPNGMTRPGVVILPQQHKTDGIVSRIETVVEHVYPSATAYTHGYAAKEDAYNEWGKPAGHCEDETSKINEFISNVQIAASGSGKTGLFQRRPNNLQGYGGSGTQDIATNGWSKPSATYDMGTNGWSKPHGGTHETGTNGWSKPHGGIHETGTNGWSSPSDGTHDTGTNGWSKPHGGIHETGTNGWSSPSDGTHDTGTRVWSKPSGGTNDIGTNEWGRPSSGINDANSNRFGGTNDIGTGAWGRPSSRTNDITSNGWRKPSGTTISQPFYDDSYGKNESSLDVYHTPTTTTTDGRGRPNRVGWATPPSYESKITKPTSDIGSAVDYVRDSVKPSYVTTMTPWQGRFSASSPTYPVKKTTTETIDSKEAERRYGGASVPPTAKKDPTAPIIDSREAARRYNGSFV